MLAAIPRVATENSQTFAGPCFVICPRFDLLSETSEKLAKARGSRDSNGKAKEWKHVVFASHQGVFLAGPPQISLPDKERKQDALWLISSRLRLLFFLNRSVCLLLYISSLFFFFLLSLAPRYRLVAPPPLPQSLSQTVPHTTPLVYFTPLSFSTVPMQQHFPIWTFPQHIGASPLHLQLFPALIAHLGHI